VNFVYKFTFSLKVCRADQYSQHRWRLHGRLLPHVNVDTILVGHHQCAGSDFVFLCDSGRLVTEQSGDNEPWLHETSAFDCVLRQAIAENADKYERKLRKIKSQKRRTPWFPPIHPCHAMQKQQNLSCVVSRSGYLQSIESMRKRKTHSPHAAGLLSRPRQQPKPDQLEGQLHGPLQGAVHPHGEQSCSSCSRCHSHRPRQPRQKATGC
jgi:hypothetical protein